MNHTLTILVPVYNEEECILPLVKEIDNFLEKVSIPTSVLFINDGSKDKSLELIEQVCLNNPNFTFISFKQNYGLSAALKAGIDFSSSTLVAYLDADLQTSPIDFLELLKYSEQYDLVMGYRQKRKDTKIKKTTSRFANYFRRKLLNDTIIDTGCPLKIIKTDIAKRLPFYDGMHRFIPNMVTLLEGKVKQVPIQHHHRYAGISKFNFHNRLLGPIIDALALRWMQRNSIHYQINKYSTNLYEIQQNGALTDTYYRQLIDEHSQLLGRNGNK